MLIFGLERYPIQLFQNMHCILPITVNFADVSAPFETNLISEQSSSLQPIISSL